MNDGFLSQEEIDALLKGGGDSATPEPVAAELSEMEQDALGEIGNISMGSAATTLSVLLGRRVSITTPKVEVITFENIKNNYPLPYLIIEVGYTQGIKVNNILAIREQDSLIIADLMMGGDGTNPSVELNELSMSAVGEAMNQMMGSVATSMSTMFNKMVDISPPVVNLIDLSNTNNLQNLATADGDLLVKIAFRMEVEGLIDSEIMQILPVDISKEMVDSLMNSAQDSTPPPPQDLAPQVQQAPPVQAPQAVQYAQQPQMQQAQPVMMQQPVQQQYMQNPNVVNVPVQPVQFAPLTPLGVTGNEGNIGLIMDVPLQVTVELGRTKKLIRDILELSTGSVIELDKLAGEPVDILVNGKLLAKGEVVVIDENFGVRITDIISALERASTIQ